MKELWRGLTRSARIGLVVGAGAIVVAAAVAGWWLLRADLQVLFSDLSAQDAAAMTAELEREKVPYAIGEPGAEGGTTILVDRKDVHRIRLKLMGKDLPLHGTVGFELFNASDFGMTEFAQRINYQRALQGELTRTIVSLAEVRDARVLIALPEQGLFKQARSKATASVTLTLKPGRSLAAAQITGIQRLVSAAVPGIAAADVTIVDQGGYALTRPAAADEEEASSGRLDVKRETEQYLTRKADDVLARALGAGQALASVDVTLDLDRVQTTVENVVAAQPAAGKPLTGVVVRERETVREVGTPLGRGGAQDGGAAVGGSSQREVEYAVGRRVEHVMGHPGTIKRIQVAAVVKIPLDEAQRSQLRALLAASVGASLERGDSVVIQSIAALAVKPRDGAVATSASTEANPGSPAPVAAATPAAPPRVRWTSLGAVALGFVVAAAGAALVGVRLSPRHEVRARDARAPLSEAERSAALAQIQAWTRGEGRRSPGDAA